MLNTKIQTKFIQYGWTLTLAESCTGGRISSKLVEIPGASAYFLGSLIVYSNFLKEKLLHVPSTLLESKGAVSLECAATMAQNLHKLTLSTWTGSITGIAGPSGGSPTKPVGTVFMALSFMGKDPQLFNHIFSGSREDILKQSAEMFLSHLLEVEV